MTNPPNPASDDAAPKDPAANDQARHRLQQAGTGDTNAARKVEKTHRTNPATAEAAEQEAADGPEGRGLAR